MKHLCAAVALVLGTALSAQAQSAYDRGYNAGYNDLYVPFDRQFGTNPYAQGYRAGRDDSFDDDMMMLERQRQQDRALRDEEERRN